MPQNQTQIIADLESFLQTRHSPELCPTSQPFQPKLALAFAQRLAAAKSEDEAIGLSDSSGATDFHTAAHFAIPFLRQQSSSGDDLLNSRHVPFVAGASAVAKLLSSLEGRYGIADVEE